MLLINLTEIEDFVQSGMHSIVFQKNRHTSVNGQIQSLQIHPKGGGGGTLCKVILGQIEESRGNSG